MAALFPDLLSGAFEALAGPVRRVHRGGSQVFKGIATVERGPSLIARVLCAVASLPPSLKDVPVTVDIEDLRGHERWTRRFGASAPMRSALRGRGQQLTERLGPATLTFAITAEGGAIRWQLSRIAAFGCPLPARLFEVLARSGSMGDRYHFVIDVRMRGIGRIIRYEGTLDVSN
jgi:hypothetical protein